MQIDLPEDVADSLATLAEALDTNVQTLVLYSVQTYLYSLRPTEQMKNPAVAAAFEQWKNDVGKSIVFSTTLKAS
ncbi:MAG: hypothetical protein ACK4V2_03025 [Pseudomonadota bacterium]|jgi:hypothetical protein